MWIKLLAVLIFFLAFMSLFNMITVILEMLDEKENTDYKLELGKLLQTKAVRTAILWTSFVAILIFM